MKFTYTAIDENGRKITGVLEASSVDEVNTILLEKGYIPQKVVHGEKKIGLNLFAGLSSILTKVRDQELILFTKQFRTLFRAGISVVETLSILERQAENSKLKEIISQMVVDINEGATLYQSFSKHPKVFSKLYCAMILAGETSGALPEVMDRLAFLLEHEFRVKNDIKSALQYPIIVLVALGIAFFILLTFVIPKFASVFKSAGLTLPLPTQIAIGLYNFLANYWFFCLSSVLALVIGLSYYIKTDQGRYLKDNFLLNLPIVGPVFQKAAMSRFASIFAILQSSGVSVLEALDILSETIGNAAISREFSKIKDQLREGLGISQPLKTAKYFTPMVINMIYVGEQSGNLDEMLTEISKHYDEEVAYAVAQMSTNLGPILIVGLAAVVGFFALAIFLPMWDLTKMVKM
ncbi:type II secretion system F family protein [Desulfovulcanus sp.]